MKEITNTAIPAKRSRENPRIGKPWYEQQEIKRRKKAFYDKISKSNQTQYQNYDVNYSGSMVISTKNGDLVECSSSSENTVLALFPRSYFVLLKKVTTRKHLSQPIFASQTKIVVLNCRALKNFV